MLSVLIFLSIVHSSLSPFLKDEPPPGMAVLTLVPPGKTRLEWLSHLFFNPSAALSTLSSLTTPITSFSWTPHDMHSGTAVDGEPHPGEYVRADVLPHYVTMYIPK